MIRQSITNIVRWAQRYDDNSEVPGGLNWGIPTPKATKRPTSHSVNPADIADDNYGMNFTVYGANGGKVIQISSYDPRTDKRTTALHIITDREDLGEELGMIITRESLSR